MIIVFTANTSWYLYNFRLNLMSSLKKQGHIIYFLASIDNYTNLLIEKGFIFKDVSLNRGITNLFKEIYSIYKIITFLKNNKINLVISYTPKVNIYSSIASVLNGNLYIPGISGLGSTFINKTLLTSFVLFLYKIFFKNSLKIYFENIDDLNYFINNKLVNSNKTVLVPGSGIDLVKFQPFPKINNLNTNLISNNFTFLLIARLLWDKGIQEYVDAAKIIIKLYPNVEFQILGFIDFNNPSSISKKQIDYWCQEGIITYLGETDDVRNYINASSCVVLPSYREGLPKSLLEAAALERPVITTDVPGCRQAVIDGITGYLCEVANSQDLADKILKFILLNTEERFKMGKAARNFVVTNFDENIVINSYINTINNC